MKVPNGRLSGDGSAQARRHGGQLPLNCVVLRKICLKHMIKAKIFLP